MKIKEKSKHILMELKGHAPFTGVGVILGILFMLVFRNISSAGSQILFAVFHPAHVFLSAMVTASMFKIHNVTKSFILILVIGYLGSIGIATLSDIVIPHLGSRLLKLNVPTHAQLHHLDTDQEHDRDHLKNNHSNEGKTPKGGLHLGFIEEWYIVNPAAFIGILIAFYLPGTKFPHAGHILISTWASSSYMLMTIQSEMTIAASLGIFATLFIAIWIPCCISDIIFPLLFVEPDIELSGPCPDHDRHSHSHIHK